MNTTPVVIIFVASIFTNNILLASFLGMCSFLVCSNRIDTAVGLGTALFFLGLFRLTVAEAFIFAIGFSHFLASTNLPYDLADWIIRLGLSPYAIISLMLFIYMILGCLMNAIPAVIITLPIFFPIAMAAGFDGVWFGVVVVVMIQLGQITPPIGMNVLAMAAIAIDLPMSSI